MSIPHFFYYSIYYFIHILFYIIIFYLFLFLLIICLFFACIYSLLKIILGINIIIASIIYINLLLSPAFGNIFCIKSFTPTTFTFTPSFSFGYTLSVLLPFASTLFVTILSSSCFKYSTSYLIITLFSFGSIFILNLPFPNCSISKLSLFSIFTLFSIYFAFPISLSSIITSFAFFLFYCFFYF